MADEDCVEFLGQLFTDIKCVMDVLHMQDHKGNEEETIFKCNCPVPCFSRDYEMRAGISRWPSPGPETNVAYMNIVKDGLIPELEKFNVSIANDAIKYLSVKENTAEIMQDFARVTIYVKDLRVESFEQISIFSILDLISAIGNYPVCSHMRDVDI